MIDDAIAISSAPTRAEPQHVTDARTMTPGPLAKKYPAVADAYRTVKRRAQRSGQWGFNGPNGLNEFLLALGDRPSPEHSVDRIRRTGSYAPGNVRWATRQEQANNRSTNVTLTIDGESLTVAQWAEREGQTANAIRKRLDRGWSPIAAVTGKRDLDSSPPTPQDPSLIPAPAGWEALRMKNGRALPYVPRLDPKYADRFEFPSDAWPWAEDVCDHTETAFQRECKAGHRRIDHLLLQLDVYIARIEQHCDAYLGRVQTTTTRSERGYRLLPAPPVEVSKPCQPDLFLKPTKAPVPIRPLTARSYAPGVEETEVVGGIRGKLYDLERFQQLDEETGEPYWAHPTLSPEECESRHQKLTGLIEEALARKERLLAPFLALRAEAHYRIDNTCLPSFWRAVAERALKKLPGRPEADQEAW